MSFPELLSFYFRSKVSLSSCLVLRVTFSPIKTDSVLDTSSCPVGRLIGPGPVSDYSFSNLKFAILTELVLHRRSVRQPDTGVCCGLAYPTVHRGVGFQ